MLHYTLTPARQKKLQKLTLAYDRISHVAATLSRDQLSFVAAQSMISNIGASTRIENAVLTDIEVEWIDTTIKAEPHLEYANRERFIKDKLSKDKERSIEEVAGYRAAIQIVSSSAADFNPLSIATVKGLHREMLRYYSSAEYHAGDFKTVPNTVVETDSVTGRQRTVLKTADPGIATETAMADLVSWYNEEVDANAATIAVAVEFVFRFLAIHPFQDGNGRLSRLLFHAALMAPKESPFRQSAPLCAIDRAIERSRSTYYRVLQRCSGGVFNADPAAYEYAHFLDYMVDVLAESQKNFSHYCEKFDRFQGLSDTALRILECFRDAPEHLMTTGMLIERTSVPRRTVIYSLNSLVAAGFVQSLGSGAGRRYRLVF